MKSKPFCVHPFVRHYVSTEGFSELCCEADRAIQGQTPTTDWHADHMQHARALWNQGVWPAECQRCHSIEAQGGRSLRHIINDRYSDLYQHYRTHATTRPAAPVAYDLRLSNRCNLQCVMCNPESSDQIDRTLSAWLGEAPRSVAPESHTQHLVDHIIQHAPEVQHLQLAGGEPFVMPGVTRLLDALCRSGDARHMDLEVTTNGTVLRTQWINEWFAQFRSCMISVSVDAVGDRAEYVRWGHRWPTLSRRIRDMHMAMRNWSNCDMNVGATVHAATVSHIPLLKQWCDAEQLPVVFSCVTEPRWLMPHRAPRHIRNEVCAWIRSLPPMEQRDTDLAPTVLKALEMPGEHTTEDDEAQHRYIQYLNGTRGRRWRDAVPELAHWDVEP